MKNLWILIPLLLLCSALRAQVISAEYFFDADPGVGNGTTISVTAGNNINRSFTVPTAGMTPGFHNLFVRVKNNMGVWSHYEGRLVYIMSPVPATASQVVSGEWFMDTDPGIGNGTAISITASQNISKAISLPASLAPGFHNLYIRVKNNTGVWSHYEGRLVYIMSPIPTSATQVVSGEWFMDTDPGIGNGTAISITASQNVNKAISLPASLSPGFHNLFIRVKNNEGIWSHYEGRMIYIMENPPVVTSQVMSGEWFVDTDPGIGNGTAISFTAGANVTPLVNMNTTGIATGVHNLFIRVKDNKNKWSHYEGRQFVICTNPMIAATINGAQQFCAGNTVNLTADSVSGATSYVWSGPGSYSVSGLVVTRNNATAAMSGVYTLKAIRGGGTACDTVQSSIAITVYPTSAIQKTVTICAGNSYTFKGQSLKQGGVYVDTLQNRYGCDSIVTLTLTVNPPLQSSMSQTICSGNSFTFKGQALKQNGIYRDTVQTAQGCDSIVTLTLIVNPPLQGSITRTICTGSSFAFKGQALKQGGTYRDTLQNNQGCDSIVTLALTVNPPLQSSINRTICSGSSFTFKGLALKQGGTYRDTAQTIQGCDSIVTLLLSVNPPLQKNLSQTICAGSSFTFKGQVISQSGIYRDTLQTAQGCDSIVVLNLTVLTIDTSVTVSGTTATANEQGATYQWLDCDSNFAEITGATAESFAPQVSGNYAVKITKNNCTDTSACVTLLATGISDLSNSIPKIIVYPNPNNGVFTVEVYGIKRQYEITITDAIGRVILSRTNQTGKSEISMGNQADGIYFIQLKGEEEWVNEKIVVHK